MKEVIIKRAVILVTNKEHHNRIILILFTIGRNPDFPYLYTYFQYNYMQEFAGELQEKILNLNNAAL